MKKVLTVILILMVILTVIYVSAVVYSNMNANSSNVGDSGGGKRPTEYGILRAYFAKLETEPQEWNTTEELGIMFGKRMRAEKEAYEILIVNPEKALPWMKDIIPEPDAIKYEDNFYNIVFLWVTPGIPEGVNQWQIPLGVALGACWVFTGVLFLKWRKKE
jgi:hypothetical protein